MHVSSTSTPARRGLARSSPVTVTSRFGRSATACCFSIREAPAPAGSSCRWRWDDSPSKTDACGAASSSSRAECNEERHGERSRIAPRLRPPTDEAGRADPVWNGKGPAGRSRIAPRLRPPTDDAGLADLVWNGKGPAGRSRIAPRLRPPTDRTGPGGPATVRVLIAKPGLDGHDRGAKVVAQALRDAGVEVVYSGLKRTPDEIVHEAIQEDVDVVGLSVLSGAHLLLSRRVLEGLRAYGADEIEVVVGGIIPPRDVEELQKLGVARVFPMGTPLPDIVAAFTKEASQ